MEYYRRKSNSRNQGLSINKQNTMTTEEAIKNLQLLIDSCIAKGGIFTSFQQLAVFQASLNTLIQNNVNDQSKQLSAVSDNG